MALAARMVGSCELRRVEASVSVRNVAKGRREGVPGGAAQGGLHVAEQAGEGGDTDARHDGGGQGEERVGSEHDAAAASAFAQPLGTDGAAELAVVAHDVVACEA